MRNSSKSRSRLRIGVHRVWHCPQPLSIAVIASLLMSIMTRSSAHLTAVCTTTAQSEDACDGPDGVVVWLATFHRNQSGFAGPGPVFQGNFTVKNSAGDPVSMVTDVIQCDFGATSVASGTMAAMRSQLHGGSPTCNLIPATVDGTLGRAIGTPTPFPWGDADVRCFTHDGTVASETGHVYVRAATDSEVPYCYPTPHTSVSPTWYGISLPAAQSGRYMLYANNVGTRLEAATPLSETPAEAVSACDFPFVGDSESDRALVFDVQVPTCGEQCMSTPLSIAAALESDPVRLDLTSVEDCATPPVPSGYVCPMPTCLPGFTLLSSGTSGIECRNGSFFGSFRCVNCGACDAGFVMTENCSVTAVNGTGDVEYVYSDRQCEPTTTMTTSTMTSSTMSTGTTSTVSTVTSVTHTSTTMTSVTTSSTTSSSTSSTSQTSSTVSTTTSTKTSTTSTRTTTSDTSTSTTTSTSSSTVSTTSVSSSTVSSTTMSSTTTSVTSSTITSSTISTISSTSSSTTSATTSTTSSSVTTSTTSQTETSTTMSTTTETLDNGCLDAPGDWTSSTGHTCSDYEGRLWCTPEGTEGTGWPIGPLRIADFADSDGVDALAACCACGGGFVRTTTTTVSTTTVSSTTTTLSTTTSTSSVSSTSTQTSVTSTVTPEYGSCLDSPPDWMDSGNATCVDYFRLAMCTASGAEGPGWPAVFGMLSDRSDSRGIDAASACCVCGGGRARSSVTTTTSSITSTTPTTTVTSTVTTTMTTTPTTFSPTLSPSQVPTVSPSDAPTDLPSVSPTNAPSVSPTMLPTLFPTTTATTTMTTTPTTTATTTPMTLLGDISLVNADGEAIQDAIDAFGSAGIISGSVIIQNTTITTAQLAELLGRVMTIEGHLIIDNNDELESIVGLSIESIGSFFTVSNNDNLLAIPPGSWMGTLTVSAGLNILNNINLKSLCGLAGVVAREYSVTGNPDLRMAPEPLQTSGLIVHECTRGLFDLIAVADVTAHPTVGICFRGLAGVELLTNAFLQGPTRITTHVVIPVNQSGYIFAKSDSSGSRYAGLYAHRTGRLSFYYRCSGDSVQRRVTWHSSRVSDGVAHSISVSLNSGVVGLAVDGSVYGVQNLECPIDDCGARNTDCVMHLGQRQVDPQGKSFPLTGCISSAFVENVYDGTFDGLYVNLLDGSVSTFSATSAPSLGSQSTSCFSATSPGFALASSLPLVPLDGIFTAVFLVSVQSSGFGYIFSKSGPGDHRFYSLYVSRSRPVVTFYYSIKGSSAQKNVDFPVDISDGKMHSILVSVGQSDGISTVYLVVDGALHLRAVLPGELDDCDTLDSTTCTFFLAKRRNAFDLTNGCISLAHFFASFEARYPTSPLFTAVATAVTTTTAVPASVSATCGEPSDDEPLCVFVPFCRDLVDAAIRCPHTCCGF